MGRRGGERRTQHRVLTRRKQMRHVRARPRWPGCRDGGGKALRPLVMFWRCDINVGGRGVFAREHARL